MLRSKNIFMNAFPKDTLTDNTLVLTIYFSSLQHLSVISKTAYPTMALFSDVGGALGLLLGATLLTVYEVVEFTVMLAHDAALTRRRLIPEMNN